MQFILAIAAVAEHQVAATVLGQDEARLSEPREIDESLLAQISGGVSDAPGSGW